MALSIFGTEAGEILHQKGGTFTPEEGQRQRAAWKKLFEEVGAEVLELREDVIVRADKVRKPASSFSHPNEDEIHRMLLDESLPLTPRTPH